jgi:hypothetical protein
MFRFLAPRVGFYEINLVSRLAYGFGILTYDLKYKFSPIRQNNPKRKTPLQGGFFSVLRG